MKKLNFAALTAFIVILISSCQTAIDQPDKVQPKSKMDSISYIIGYDYGSGIRNQEIEADPIMIYKGLYDALKKDSGYFNDTVRQQLVDDFNKVVEDIENKRFLEMVIKNKQEGTAFLEANKKQPGVVELPSGLQYKILKLGNGNVFPAANDSITIHYRAMYTDRTTFDMSYETGPVGIGLNHMVKGLAEGIQLMRKGAIYEFYIPSKLGYGDNNYRDMIPGGSTVIYSVELIDIH
ncbi:MAG: FKBP-type peptidyl-prolyl cis-trans isomerase [Bacteroidales bacterium]|nr:FKBP-type peptidyl-prolyl cis-trans isomerase [Bacteroidales bacterium]